MCLNIITSYANANEFQFLLSFLQAMLILQDLVYYISGVGTLKHRFLAEFCQHEPVNLSLI